MDKHENIGYLDTEQNKAVYPFANKEFKLTQTLQPPASSGDSMPFLDCYKLKVLFGG